jgi:hypothetical protein
MQTDRRKQGEILMGVPWIRMNAVICDSICDSNYHDDNNNNEQYEYPYGTWKGSESSRGQKAAAPLIVTTQAREEWTKF